MKRRSARTVLLGLTLGLALSFGYVSFAQGGSGEPMPLVQALRVVAVAADVELVVAGVPTAEVYLPSRSDDWSAVLRQLAAVYGLTVCDLGPRTLLVTDSAYAAEVCGEAVEDEEPRASEPAPIDAAAPVGGSVQLEEAESLVEEEAAPGSLVYRFRVLQLDENRAREIGLDWSSGVFDVAGRIVLAGTQVYNGMWPSARLAEIVSFLETEGVAMRLDDLELRARGGEPVRFQRGGTINVNLVGGGDTSIVERFDYGLTLELVGVIEGESVALSYLFADSAPGNVSDPRNVQLSSTSASSALDVPCGYSTVLAGLGSQREGLQGQGLPVLAAVPGVGYAFGVGGYIGSQVAYVVTVDVSCSA